MRVDTFRNKAIAKAVIIEKWTVGDVCLFWPIHARAVEKLVKLAELQKWDLENLDVSTEDRPVSAFCAHYFTGPVEDAGP